MAKGLEFDGNLEFQDVSLNDDIQIADDIDPVEIPDEKPVVADEKIENGEEAESNVKEEIPYMMDEETLKKLEETPPKEGEELIKNEQEESEGTEGVEKDSLLSLLPEVYLEEGLFEFSEEELAEIRENSKDDSEALLTLTQKGIEKRINSLYEKETSAFKAWQEARQYGVVPDPLVEINESLEIYEGIDPNLFDENVDAAKTLYREYLKKAAPTLKETDIDKWVEREEDVVSVAKEKLPELIDLYKEDKKILHDKAIKIKEERELENQRIAKEMQDFSAELVGKEFLPGVKVTDKLIKEATDLVSLDRKTNKVPLHDYVNKIGRTKFDILLGVMVKAGLFENKTFEKVQKSAEKSAKNKVIEKLNSGGKFYLGNSKTPNKKKGTSDNLGKYL